VERRVRTHNFAGKESKSGLQIGHREKNSRAKKLKTQEKNSNSSPKLNFSAYFGKFVLSLLFFPYKNSMILTK